uniref:CBS domain-containing protein CBSX5-like n=1 Tax=Erigeron canadensis TaxID=72917 RepID=UPI001CB88B92|nr:CBS domain-containing protein CBSX5-like [Erigeron canadensis]
MAHAFLARQVSDLCVGKQPLSSLPATASIADTVIALKRSGNIDISIWNCNHLTDFKDSGINDNVVSCWCVGKICMVDVIAFICKDENVARPLDVLEQTSVLDLISGEGKIKHLESNSSLLEAIDCILEGAQNLVIPIETTRYNQRKRQVITKTSPLGTTTLHNGQEFCWITREDVIRFMLDSINVFSPVPTFTIDSLDVINTDTLTIYYDDPAYSALPLITNSHLNQTSIAVVNQDNTLIGEISPFSLSCCDETIIAAVATLSAGDLMAYLDYSGPPEDLVHLVKMRLQERKLSAMLDLMEDYNSAASSFSSSSSSDEEFGSGKNGGIMGRSNPWRRSEAIVCNPWNTLMAVMVQMIAHRVSYAWVVKEDYGLIGIVTFTDILRRLRSSVDFLSKHTEENTNMQ